MNHKEIEERQIVDLYVMGRLAEPEAQRFEEHYLSCQQCLEELAVAEKMQLGFKGAAAQQAVEVAVGQRLGLLARLARSPRMGVLLPALLVAVLLIPSGLLYQRLEQARHELTDTQNALEAIAQNPASPPIEKTPETPAGQTFSDPSPVVQQNSSSAVEALQQELAQLENRAAQQLAEEKEARQRLARRLETATRPQGNTRIYYLSPERSAAQAEEPTYLIRLTAEPRWVVLALELETPQFAHYRAVLENEGKKVWSDDALTPDSTDTVILSLFSSDLQPGIFQLHLSGVTLDRKGGDGSAADGSSEVPVASFYFRVLPASEEKG